MCDVYLNIAIAANVTFCIIGVLTAQHEMCTNFSRPSSLPKKRRGLEARLHIGVPLAPDWTTTPSLWSYRAILWIFVQKKFKIFLLAHGRTVTALAREYRKSALQVHEQWYQETVARFLVKKSQKTWKNCHKPLGSVPNNERAFLWSCYEYCSYPICTAHKCQLRSN